MAAILLLQLGTPDAPTPEAVGPYLQQFLSDQRVIQRHPCVWQPILRLLIVPRRRHASAEKYKLIWDEETGSPLLHWTRRQAQLLNDCANDQVYFAMRYGNPSIPDVVAQIQADGHDRILALPLFPQFSHTTTSSAVDALTEALPPNVEAVILPSFPDHPAYIDAVCARLQEHLSGLESPPERIIVALHGIPQHYADAGDPYEAECKRTFIAIQARFPTHQVDLAYQSRFGPIAWLKPYLEEHVVKLASEGIKNIIVVQPGFAADCLETIDEVGREVRHAFERAGGEQFHRVDCLNDHEDWIDALLTLTGAP
jgi:protoporphyrin/coproporphyrin ferrochelatase